MNAGQDPFDFSSPYTDVAVLYAAQPVEGFVCLELVREQIIPVCSPELLSRHSPESVEDLLRMPRIHCSIRPNEWPDWFATLGVTIASNSAEHEMSSRELAIHAAAAGLGVALGHAPLIDGSLEAGQLVVPYDHAMQSEHAYFLVTPAEKLLLPRVKALWEWASEVAACSH